MGFFANFDANGLPVSLISGSVKPDADMVELTTAMWNEFRENAGARRWDAATKSIVPYTPPPPPLNQVRAARVAAINNDCAKHIRAGFVSSALGATHTYPANDIDQLNLSRAVNAALRNQTTQGWVTPYWCADANSVWELRKHDATQIQQVEADGLAAIVRAQQRNAALAAAVNAATTEAEVNAIVWTTTW